MIPLETLAADLQAGLNNNSEQLVFSIMSDMGEYSGAVRKLNKVTQHINGILTSVSSNIQSSQGLNIAVQTAQLRLLVSVDESEADIQPDVEPGSVKYEEYLISLIKQKISTVRMVFESYLQSNIIRTLSDENGKPYSVALQGAMLNTETADIRGEAGLSIELYTFLSYSFLQNGLNSDDALIFLDGERIHYITATLTRSPVTELNAFSNTGGNSKAITTSKAFGLDLTMPALSTKNGINAVSASVLDFILTGNVSVHNLKVEIEGVPNTYSVILGATQMSLDGIKNAAYNVAFVEAADFGEED